MPRPAVDRHYRRAHRRLATVTGSARRQPLSAWLYARGPAQHAVTAMILALRQLPEPRRDDALQAVLTTAIAVAHRETAAASPSEPELTL